MPRATVAVVHGLRALGQPAHHVRTPAREPVGVRQHHHRLGLQRRRLDDALVHGDHDLGEVHVRRDGGTERFGGRLAHGRLDAVEQCADVAILPILSHGGVEFRTDIRG